MHDEQRLAVRIRDDGVGELVRVARDDDVDFVIEACDDAVERTGRWRRVAARRTRVRRLGVTLVDLKHDGPNALPSELGYVRTGSVTTMKNFSSR